MDTESWTLKLRRAQEHKRAFEVEVEDFIRMHRDAVTVRFEPDSEPGYYVGRVASVAELPDRIGLLIGDATHNFRSALDHLMWALARSCLGREPWERTQFPITSSWAAWTSPPATRILRQLSPELVAHLDSYQPYHAGDKAHTRVLAWLAKLDNEDKHRSIRPVLFASNEVGMFPGRGLVTTKEFELTKDLPIKVGYQLVRFRIIGSPPGGKIDMRGHISVNVAFNNGLIVSEVLEWFDTAVAHIIEELTPFI